MMQRKRSGVQPEMPSAEERKTILESMGKPYWLETKFDWLLSLYIWRLSSSKSPFYELDFAVAISWIKKDLKFEMCELFRIERPGFINTSCHRNLTSFYWKIWVSMQLVWKLLKVETTLLWNAKYEINGTWRKSVWKDGVGEHCSVVLSSKTGAGWKVGTCNIFLALSGSGQ